MKDKKNYKAPKLLLSAGIALMLLSGIIDDTTGLRSLSLTMFCSSAIIAFSSFATAMAIHDGR